MTFSDQRLTNATGQILVAGQTPTQDPLPRVAA
jgi:hypothetical protein